MLMVKLKVIIMKELNYYFNRKFILITATVTINVSKMKSMGKFMTV